MPKITIDRRVVEFNEGETILEVAWRQGIKIPVFCYHPKLNPEASCRICLVEVKQNGRGFLAPACATKASDGMVVATDTPEVRENVRARTLELLLANHPTECPVCDAGGECDLQSFAFEMGEPKSIYDFPKREQPYFKVGPFLRLYPNRCVQCTRCVRLYQEVFGEYDWDRWERGWEITVGPGRDKPLESEFAGNLADVCPVGAITSGDYAFTSRPWENQVTLSVSPEDSLAAPVALITRKQGRESRGPFKTGGRREDLHRVLRICASEGEGYPGWISDRDRFSHEYLNKKRIDRAFARRGGEIVELSTDEAIGLLFRAVRDAWRKTPYRIAVLSGARASNEAAYLAVRFFREVFEVKSMDFRAPWHSFSPDPIEEVLGYSAGSRSLESLRDSDLILVFGEEIGERHPLLWLYLLEAKRAGARIVSVSPWLDKYSRRLEHIRYHPAQEEKVAHSILSGLARAKGLKVSGLSAVPHPIGEDLARAKDPVIIFPDDISCGAQRALAYMVGVLDAGLVLLRTQPNGQGFYDMGFRPVDDNNTLKILRRAAEGEIDLLILWDVDPLLEWPERELCERALRNAGLVVWLGSFADDPSLAYADLAIPVVLPYESWGSRTATDGRVLWHERAVHWPGGAVPAGVVFSKLLEKAGRGGYRDVSDVTRAIQSKIPAYRDVSMPPLTTNNPYPDDIPSLARFRLRRRFSLAGYEHKPKEIAFSSPEEHTGEGLLLVAAPSLYRSSYYAFRCSILEEYMPLERVELHPDDARALGVSEGDLIRLSSNGHHLSLRAHISERTHPGVLRFSPLFFDSPVNLILGQDMKAWVKAEKEVKR
ncbi:MAG: 2Fe-2S iron-sulfur cluster-binding protein [candidate division WOR-3 bacterium]